MVVEGGEDVRLACPLRANSSSSTLSWYKRMEEKVLLVLSTTLTSTLKSTLTPTSTLTPRPRVKYGQGFGPDRFTLDPRQPQNLLLLRPRPDDAGVYFCSLGRRTKIT